VALLSPSFSLENFRGRCATRNTNGTEHITKRHHPCPEYLHITAAIGRPIIQPLFDTFFAVILLKTSNPLAPIGLLAGSIALCGSNVLLGAIV